MDKNDKIIEIAEYVDFTHDSNDQIPMSVPDSDAENSDFKEVLLPSALSLHSLKLKMIAVVFCVAGIAVTLYLKSYGPLSLLAFALYFMYRGISIKKRYQNGLIREVAVLCTGVKSSNIRDRMTVTFRTEDDEEADCHQEYFKFTNISKRKADDFLLNYPYLIYFDLENPQALLGYIEI